MLAEAVRVGAHPSRVGLIRDTGGQLNCEECATYYYLYYDREAGGSLTYWSILAQEIITARHPRHKDNVFLDVVEQF